MDIEAFVGWLVDAIHNSDRKEDVIFEYISFDKVKIEIKNENFEESFIMTVENETD